MTAGIILLITRSNFRPEFDMLLWAAIAARLSDQSDSESLKDQCMARKFLITGGTGFLGSALARRLLTVGHSVRIFDDNSRGVPRRLADIAADLELIHGDVRDSNRISTAASGVD